LLAGLVIAVLIAVFLRRGQRPENPALPPSFTPGPGVVLRASEVPSGQDSGRTFLLTYDAQEPVNRFRFFYTPKAPSGDSPFVITRGALETDSGSNTALLAALAAMHGGRPPAPSSTRVAHMTIDVAVLGERLARQAGEHLIAGEFTDEVPGSWLVTKLFLPAAAEDEEQPEVFLVIDADGGRAEFLMKDPEYWPALGERLATVL
jgi:hypothetical protein